MQKFDTIFKNGEIITENGKEKTDLGILNGKISAIGILNDEASVIEDASNLIILPGGVDAHVHIDQPSGPDVEMADNFQTATMSAAAGGSTTILPFAMQEKGQSLRKCVEDYHKKATNNLYIDTSFHLIISDPSPQVLGQELPALARDGYTSFKVFMTYDDLVLNDAELLEVFEVAKKEKTLVMVHAEGYDAIRYLTKKLEDEGKLAPYYHGLSRPQIVEREATHRAISHAEIVDIPIVIVHVSGNEALSQIKWAKNKGIKVFSETCPQYICLTEDDMKGLNMDFEGAKYVCSPPPRDLESQKAIWEGLIDGTFDIFSSDHCPFKFKDKKGKDRPGARTSFKWVPNGIPGVETRLPILFSEGVSKKRITIERFVELTSTNPAKMYGLYPQKGSIKVGADADLTIWDPNKIAKIKQSNLHHGSDYTPYENLEIKGWPIETWLRGIKIFGNGEFIIKENMGKYISRGFSSL
ncbi:MAG: dihydropyrimidinase [Proteobacteria bacterium]|jgi:dihydropyrimidinase|nr:dihydropyrimidinase [Pseudomonadota bacterium]MDA1135706.1 dihydropyrimidinase [Pseudomonadota bacterium]|tara:strand:+ start:2390 stop:3796 length:1407 start_codon:yes stop_codon:yes gene_type:complete